MERGRRSDLREGRGGRAEGGEMGERRFVWVWVELGVLWWFKSAGTRGIWVIVDSGVDRQPSD